MQMPEQGSHIGKTEKSHKRNQTRDLQLGRKITT
jgi:hypothetical protein